MLIWKLSKNKVTYYDTYEGEFKSGYTRLLEIFQIKKIKTCLGAIQIYLQTQ